MLQVRILPGLYVLWEIVMKKIFQFFAESYAELKKVVWPTRDDVTSSTKVVIVSTLIFGIVLGVVDFLLLAGIDLIF